MAFEELKLADLLIDVENPRLSKPNLGQEDAQRELAKLDPRKFLSLAEDVVESGLNPADLPIVIPTPDRNQYIVVEGNRRLSAIRGLEKPDNFSSVLSGAQMKALHEFSKEYLKAPVELVPCAVLENRTAAQHWIELKHTGENNGAGTVPWGTDEKDRFKARIAMKYEFHTQILNFLEQQGQLTTEERSKVPASTLKRLVSTADVREKCGIEKNADGDLVLRADPKVVAKALLHLVRDLLSKTVKVSDLYTVEQRREYLDELPASVVVTPTIPAGKGKPVPQDTAGEVKRQAKIPRRRTRETLIPNDCKFSITDPRIQDIADELRRLKFENYPNAISVLFRVFVELSVDDYLKYIGSAVTENDILATKMGAVLDDLLKKKKLDAQQATPVRRAMQKGALLLPSITMMHAYIHNKHVFPEARDLKPGWDNLQPFMVAIWSPRK